MKRKKRMGENRRKKKGRKAGEKGRKRKLKWALPENEHVTGQLKLS